MADLKRTPLFEFHHAHGARFVDFGGWEMPVQYKSILDEHRLVRRAAGLFDVSHMGEVEVKGPGALGFLNRLVTNDVSKLFPGRVLYTPMCQPDGGVVDDLLIYRRGEEDFLLCINAGNIDKDVAWILASARPGECTIENRSDDFALLALQGPAAAATLAQLTGVDLAALKYYHFAPGEVAVADCLIARTGYTGEDGFELFCKPADAASLATKLLEAGAAHGVDVAGLGARDSLRLEAGYSLYGHEISEKITPLQAGLGWTVKLDKGDFIGRDALLTQKTGGMPSRIMFFRTGDRRIVRAGTPVLSGGEQVGEVVSGTLSPILNEAIGSALVRAGAADLSVDVRGDAINLTVVKPPFVPLPPKP
ncbi:MAG TPA: glycine cleavage system aminomethyltransferase GcvT [Opitutaceae bacterium]|nr:glycine cleavage system aminomethyltransferase GcvT [Opitutaceae bacterium]